MVRSSVTFGLGAAALGCVGSTALGSSVTFNAPGFVAKAIFDDAVAGTLKITLTNTSMADVLIPSDVLTGVFFDSDDTTLTRTSAKLAGGALVVKGLTPQVQPPGGVVGGEFAYKYSTSWAAPHGARQGISSAGLGLFGPGDRFPGNDLDPPPNPDGLNYGITSAGDSLGTGNAEVTGNVPLIKNSVVFELTNWGGTLASIRNVSFQYGTALTEPNLVAIPLPTGAGMALAGMGVIGIRRRRA